MLWQLAPLPARVAAAHVVDTPTCRGCGEWGTIFRREMPERTGIPYVHSGIFVWNSMLYALAAALDKNAKDGENNKEQNKSDCKRFDNTPCELLDADFIFWQTSVKGDHSHGDHGSKRNFDGHAQNIKYVLSHGNVVSRRSRPFKVDRTVGIIKNRKKQAKYETVNSGFKYFSFHSIPASMSGHLKFSLYRP
jgi:hypothetical protein